MLVTTNQTQIHHACMYFWQKKNYESFAPSPLHARYRSLLRLYSHMVTVTRPRSQSCMHACMIIMRCSRHAEHIWTRPRPPSGNVRRQALEKVYFVSSNFHENLIFLFQVQNRSYDLQFFKTGQLSSLTGLLRWQWFGFFWIFHMCKFRMTKYKKLWYFTRR